MIFEFRKSDKAYCHITESKNLRYLKGLGLSFKEFLKKYV